MQLAGHLADLLQPIQVRCQLLICKRAGVEAELGICVIRGNTSPAFFVDLHALATAA